MECNVLFDDVICIGEIIDVNINQWLIENIFFKNSFLYDGVMVISKKCIKVVGCIFLVFYNLDIFKELGFCYWVVMGILQVLDVLVIIVFEEIGVIFVVWCGQFYLWQSVEELESLLIKES